MAKQDAVYGGLNLELEWNALLFARTYGYITKGMFRYRVSFQGVLSVTRELSTR